jgi:hypothetical protein
MNNRNFPWAIIAAAAVAGAGFAGIASYVRQDSKSTLQVNQNDDGTGSTTVITDPLSGDHSKSGDTSKNGGETNQERQAVRTSKVNALNDAFKAKSFDQKGIRVLDVTVDNGNAIVDMNDPVRYNWGSEEESEFIRLMADTLAKFDSVKTFQIRVDGEILKTLSHFEIDPVKVR